MSQIWLRHRRRPWPGLRPFRSRLLASVDGAPPVTLDGGQVVLPAAPGRHHLRVWSRTDPLLGSTGWFDTLDREQRVGDTWIDVPAGATVEVEYRPGWHHQAAAQLRVVHVHVHVDVPGRGPGHGHRPTTGPGGPPAPPAPAAPR